MESSTMINIGKKKKKKDKDRFIITETLIWFLAILMFLL